MATDGKETTAELRRLSKLLLGSSYQAEIGAAIAAAGTPVWGADLVEAIGLEPKARGLMSNELARLQTATLLVPTSENGFDRRKRLVPADPDSPYWALCGRLRAGEA